MKDWNSYAYQLVKKSKLQRRKIGIRKIVGDMKNIATFKEKTKKDFSHAEYSSKVYLVLSKIMGGIIPNDLILWIN